MPRRKSTIVMFGALVVAAAALTATIGCGNKEEAKPPANSSYYSGDDFKGNTGKGTKAKGFMPPGAQPAQPAQPAQQGN